MTLPHEPTEETRGKVFALASFGVKREDIARFIDISEPTLLKYYPDELDKARIDRNSNVATFLYHSASGSAIKDGASYADCLRAAMFWLKTQGGWKETDRVEADVTSNGQTIGTVDPALAAALAKKLTGG